MGGASGGIAGISEAGAGAPAAWDRFARWTRAPARLALLTLALTLLLATMNALGPASKVERAPEPASTLSGADASGESADLNDRGADRDLKLYDEVVAHVAKGDNYYTFIAPLQRRMGYPVTPSLVVRLPTLAYFSAAVGPSGLTLAAVALMAAVMLVWLRRLRDENLGTQPVLIAAMVLLFLGASLGLFSYFFVMHELWAGMLIALSFGLHRPAGNGQPARWGASLAVAALALAVRETALPFVCLMAAFSAWRRDGRQFAAWCALIAIFLSALALHASLVAAHVHPGDAASPSWLAMRGLEGWLSKVVGTTNLRLLPAWLAWPLAVLALFGWMGWKSAAGTFGTFLYVGYGLAFMIAGRDDNYYWGFLVAPAILMGLAFAPQALRSLIAAARSPASPAPALAKTLRADGP